MAVTVTWTYPVQSTTGPTAAQASGVFVQVANVFFADTDTQAAFTHNWGLPASFPTFLFPETFYVQQADAAASTWLTALTFNVTNTNVVLINKVSATASGGTFTVYLRRPHSLGQ